MADIMVTNAVRDDVSAAIAFKGGEATQAVIGGNDEQFAIIINNTDTVAAGIVVMAGNGIRSSIGNLVVSVGAGEMRTLVLDSMRFKMLSGVNAGKIEIKICKSGTPSTAYNGTIANVKLAAIQL